MREQRHTYALLALAIAGFVIATFLAAEVLDPPWLAAPSVGVLGVALLAADVVLPVPSSGVMIAHGASFGVVAGAALSLVGGTIAAVVAFALGRSGQRLVDRFTSAQQQEQAHRLLARHGFWAIVATRPIPVIAETVGILSGTAGAMTWRKVAVAGLLGNMLPAVAYAYVGAHATGGVPGLAIVVAVISLSILLWLGQRTRERWWQRTRSGHLDHDDAHPA